jgi:Fe-S oxidoreductase
MLAFLIVTAYAIFLFSYLLRTRLAYIRLGRKIEFDGEVKERYRKVIENVFGQKKLLKDRKSGIIHVLFFYGFILVQFGALDFIIKGLFPGHHLPFGPFYGGFTFFQEIVTLLILVAVLWAFHRRYIEKLVRLKRGFKSGLVLLFIGGLMISVLAGNGMSLIWHNEQLGWSEPVASLIASLFSFLPETGATILFYVAWWVHLLLLLAFLVYVPQSKHAHLIAGPANVYLNRLTPPGKLEKIDFEDESKETFGVGTIEEFTQGQLLDLYACVECGRCTNVCPATGTGKMLSPMDLILKLRDHLTNKGAAVTSRTPWVPAFAFNNTHGNQLALKSKQQGIEESAATLSYNPSLIGDVITEEEIWACTTCRNCEDQCPVMNEHVDKIIDLRRYLVLTEGKLDGDGKRAMTNIERQGNPWGINRKEKEKWRTLQDINVPTVKELKKEGKTFQYLLWVGSMGALDNRSQKITFSLVRLLDEAGLGNEFLFQELVAANIQEFEKNEVKNIITIDPHAYNTFKNEYPDFGFKGNVYHHTEILASLLKEKKLVPKYEVNESITFHDSCYLGRYNEVYEPPREILKAIPGVNVLEMERNREKGMCCGAGGGLMWMEETAGSRINVTRTEQALEVKPTVISSGCPYCLTMLSDGTKAKEVEDKIGTYDVAELLEKAVFGSGEKA